MIDAHSMSWPALLALGAGHGINPAMGWLFAVALGLQRQSRGAVWGALGPLAVGHGLAIAAAIAAAGLVGLIVPVEVLKWGTAGLLVGLGGYRLVRSRHIAYGGMRVDSRELATWSFLMASAHGAGLMVLPLVIGGAPAGGGVHRQSDSTGGRSARPLSGKVRPKASSKWAWSTAGEMLGGVLGVPPRSTVWMR